jgi:methylated-DNA-[protein]-cysteine S-methyltransferase
MNIREARYVCVPTRLKPYSAFIAVGQEGLVCLSLQSKTDGKLDELSKHFILKHSPRDGTLQKLGQRLDHYMAGHRRFESPVPIHSWWADPVDRDVYRIIRKSVEGETMTYGEVARRVGSPSLSRRVGLALSRNWTLIAIPCHRIIRSDQSLGGFTGGLDLKVRLLQIEQRFAKVAPHLMASM